MRCAASSPCTAAPGAGRVLLLREASAAGLGTAATAIAVSFSALTGVVSLAGRGHATVCRPLPDGLLTPAYAKRAAARADAELHSSSSSSSSSFSSSAHSNQPLPQSPSRFSNYLNCRKEAQNRQKRSSIHGKLELLVVVVSTPRRDKRRGGCGSGREKIMRGRQGAMRRERLTRWHGQLWRRPATADAAPAAVMRRRATGGTK